MTRALITGVAGQDGSYLAEQLLGLGYDVHGVVRPGGGHVVDGVIVHELDLLEGGAAALVDGLRPDEIYNLAAISSVFRSWQEPALTARANGALVAELLGAARQVQESTSREIRIVQASSAEIFGTPTESPQTEGTTIAPTSPYGAAKAYAHQLVRVYRGAGLFASSCILYNHESPRRPEAFVTRKITLAAARISRGLQDRLQLGSLAARRDWGWAPDYVDALVRAAHHDVAEDFVIATGISHSVEDFVEAAFARVGIDWREVTDVDAALMRPGDAPELVGDAAQAREQLAWRPSLGFDEIVPSMVDADLALLD
jgi:GDPmannose 4,6-dehydratase